MKTASLHSAWEPPFLYSLLGLQLGLNLFMQSPLFSNSWDAAYKAVLVAPVLQLCQLVIYGIWIHSVHVDMKALWPDYPVAPWYALALTFIPLYNLWGTWALWRHAETYLSQSSRPRLSITMLVAVQYATLFGDYVVRIFQRVIGSHPAFVPIATCLSFISCVAMISLIYTVHASLSSAKTLREVPTCPSPQMPLR